MATWYTWNPFGVALELSASASNISRISATQYQATISVSWKTYYDGAKTNYGMTAASGGDSETLNSFGTASSSGSGSLAGIYTISGNGSATKTVPVTFTNFNGDTGASKSYTINLSVSVPALTSYKVTYNANGGTGAPSAQTKWSRQTLKLSTTKPTKTGYTFQGWATSASGAVKYASGADYTANAAVTLYAVWKAITYTVTYNANGGSGAPSSQTKTYGQALTLSTTKPTRSKYNFLGWATTSSATSASYKAGGSYTNNADVTLYAVWEVAYVKPRIKNLTVERCTSDGTVTSEGTYALVTFDWATDETVSSIVVKRKSSTATEWTSTNVTASGTSGSVSIVIGSGVLALDTSYTISVTVTDSIDANTATKTLTSEFYTIDVADGGTALAFGGIADEEDTFKNNFNHHQIGNSYCYQTINFDGETGYTLVATVKIKNFYANTPITFVISKRGTICPMRVHIRFANSSSSTDPDVESVVYEGDNFGAFFAKTAESMWNLYIDNTSGWSVPCVQKWSTSKSTADKIEVTFPSEQVTELPEPWYRATPAQLQSILDFIYPVGSIYMSYSHNDPASMFGGTWVRLTGGFLWASQAGDIIGQTGGEKTHTLTVDELPAHTHTIPVANTATGSNTASNKIRYNNDASSYIGSIASDSTGEGTAHNNMPPYIQVSIWRRTA